MQRVLDAIALLVLGAQGPIPLFWLFVHPFKRFWSGRAGVVYKVWAPVAWGSVLLGLIFGHRWLLEIRWSPRWPLWLAGAVLLVIDTYLLWRVEHDLGWRVLVGLPELQPEKNVAPVAQGGIYARVRHPRYLGMMLAYLAAGCYTRAPRVFLLALAGCALAILISELEEQELIERQGEEYVRYRERVPRFIPRWRGRG